MWKFKKGSVGQLKWVALHSLRYNVNIKGSGTSGPKGKRTNFFKGAVGPLSLNKIGDDIIHMKDMLVQNAWWKAEKMGA